jgi:flagellar basal-body rod protein FlgB
MLKNSLNSIDFLGRALDGSWLRNAAISNNISNINTPGYKKESVDFETVLKNQMNLSGQIQMVKTDDQHMSARGSEDISIKKNTDFSYRVDDNNVDIDVETAELAKNTIQYNALVSEVNGQFSRIKAALKINK